jgi:hypothetical protein
MTFIDMEDLVAARIRMSMSKKDTLCIYYHIIIVDEFPTTRKAEKDAADTDQNR